ncbi:NucA/NucB deoxyribonuclease domain-containing protein [Saccharothrix isguenensis]
MNGSPFGLTVKTATTAVPSSDKYRDELRGYFSYLFTATALAQGFPPDTVNLKNEFFRCDSASYVATNGQCVFYHAISSLQMSATDEDMGKSASFIRDAQNGGPNVEPAISGKQVPGKYGESELHRLYKAYDTTKSIKASRRKIKRSCITYFGSKYTQGSNGEKMQCDEYPFATTYENSSRVDPASVWNYAVRPVVATHNEAAGRYYGGWMTTDRLLDGDPFYVIIMP